MKRFLRILRRGLLFAVVFIVLAAVLVTRPIPAGQLPTTFPSIARRPLPMIMATRTLATLPKHTDPRNPFEVDLRWRDVSQLDLTDSAADLAWADFDSSTIWPSDERLPRGFDPARVMELGKDPGLGVRELHARGITGRGIAIAVIDQPLLVDHREYADRLQLYEEVGLSVVTRGGVDGSHAAMHGAATASAAVGKSVGVAPEADLYHIATTCMAFPYTGESAMTFTHYAEALHRILEINKTLPEGRKIRAVSLSIGWMRGQSGYDEITAAVREAKAQNILVTSSSMEETYGFRFHGIGRDAMADPNDFSSYRPGKFWQDEFYGLQNPFIAQFMADRLLVPMDNRTLAGPCGNDDYAHYSSGGWSWCTPYLAGVYAMGCQVDPTLTPDRFWETALKTGRTTHFQVNGQTRSLGPIIDPVALINALSFANPPATQVSGSP